MYGDQKLAEALDICGEAVALSSDDEHGRRYLFGTLPIGELIVAHARTALPWLESTRKKLRPVEKTTLSPTWRLPSLLLSVFIIGIAPTPLLRKRSPSQRNIDSPDRTSATVC
tara:strand:+ start:120 stop:458 length:339 start_codon:yes stop_codon:yes gene_type:complete